MQLSPVTHLTKSGPEINLSQNIKRAMFSNHYPSPSYCSGFGRRNKDRNTRPVPRTNPVAPKDGRRQPRAQRRASWQNEDYSLCKLDSELTYLSTMKTLRYGSPASLTLSSLS